MNKFKKLSRAEMKKISGGDPPICNIGTSCVGTLPEGQFFSNCSMGPDDLGPYPNQCACWGYDWLDMIWAPSLDPDCTAD